MGSRAVKQVEVVLVSCQGCSGEHELVCSRHKTFVSQALVGITGKRLCHATSPSPSPSNLSPRTRQPQQEANSEF
ncbi:hypothetical protein E2C01_099101 [Portunus trituberculatus]|uniref:Uncharacterized protein n=1 Tax=Portunus trituberculatus TaxID=210409 RepID=A0A5B7K2Y9_PORTR|nr:hypothetical protein [Portunus trituberculatus]